MQRARALSAASGARTFITSGARRVTVVVAGKASTPSAASEGTRLDRRKDSRHRVQQLTHTREAEPPHIEPVDVLEDVP